MNVYTYTEARQNLATLLDKALREGEVLIRGKDGQVFVSGCSRGWVPCLTSRELT